jgi:CheY-like chemotaxis protein
LRVLVADRLSVHAVISDMARREHGELNWKAGLELIQQLRKAGLSIPIFIYGSARALEKTRDEVLAVGGNGATASSIELFEMLRGALNVMG